MAQAFAVTGLGIVVATARGVANFEDSLRGGRQHFAHLQRPGRTGPTTYIGAELDVTSLEPAGKKGGLLRSASLSAQVAVDAVSQAWSDAQLDTGRIDPERIGSIIGGTNFQLRQSFEIAERYATAPTLIRPTYALSMWDTDVVGILMEYFGFAGESYCVGGASAAGAVATIHAARQLQASALDACIAVGPLFDLSRWECQALTNLGAMGSGAFADDPLRACRPFDEQHDGFVYGEGCAALVLERLDTAQRAHGTVLGWAQVYDGTRGPEPHTRGQQRAIMDALRMAELEPGQIDYVNPHGTGSPRGDRTELESLETVGLKHCWINATKSLTGHCLTASGAIEVVATLLQLRSGFLHPNRNLERPIDASFRWVPDHVLDTDLRFAVSTSFAFGGLSTALVLGPPPTSA